VDTGGGREHVMRPSMCPLSPKNQELDDRSVSAILAAAGLQPAEPEEEAFFTRPDGSPWRVDREVQLVESGPA
jgi:hypothetical protein